MVKILSFCSSTPSLPQIRSHFQTPKIFSLSLDRAKRSPLSSIILSHLAKAVALGGSVKKKSSQTTNTSASSQCC